MCMWEGQSLGIEGETKVTSKWSLALFPFSSVLQSLMGMVCPHHMNDDDERLFFFRGQCARCCAVGLCYSELFQLHFMKKPILPCLGEKQRFIGHVLEKSRSWF